MTEFEIVEIINGVSSNIIANQALFITVLSAYLVVAYSVGNNLTSYQVVFINIVFIIFSLIGAQALFGLLGFLSNYAYQLMAVRDFSEDQNASVEVFRSGMLVIRFILCLGALIFMWQVRHPRTE